MELLWFGLYGNVLLEDSARAIAGVGRLYTEKLTVVAAVCSETTLSAMDRRCRLAIVLYSTDNYRECVSCQMPTLPSLLSELYKIHVYLNLPHLCVVI